jgi:hypothetical protein
MELPIKVELSGRRSELRGEIPATYLEASVGSLITRNKFPARLPGNLCTKCLKKRVDFSTESGQIRRFPVIFPDSREVPVERRVRSRLAPPPPKYLILLSYVPLRVSQKSPRLFAALRVPRGRCGRQRRLSDRRCVADPAIISVRGCCSTVWKSVSGEVVGAGLAGDRILLAKKSAANRRSPST